MRKADWSHNACWSNLGVTASRCGRRLCATSLYQLFGDKDEIHSSRATRGHS
jgi:hypothetical protein